MPSDIKTRDTSVCVEFADEFAAAADSRNISPAAAAHVQQCLRCQAEAANYRRMRRALRDLAAEPTIVDPSLEHEILLAIDVAHGRGERRTPAVAAATVGRLTAAAGVIAAATVGALAAAAGVIAITVRRRRVVRLAS